MNTTANTGDHVWIANFPDKSTVIAEYNAAQTDDDDNTTTYENIDIIYFPNSGDILETCDSINCWNSTHESLGIKRQWTTTTPTSNINLLLTWYPKLKGLGVRHNNTPNKGWSDEIIARDIDLSDDNAVLNTIIETFEAQ